MTGFGSSDLTLAIWPQNGTRNNLWKSEIQTFPGGMPPHPPASPSIVIDQVHTGTALFKILDPPLDTGCSCQYFYRWNQNDLSSDCCCCCCCYISTLSTQYFGIIQWHKTLTEYNFLKHKCTTDYRLTHWPHGKLLNIFPTILC